MAEKNATFAQRLREGLNLRGMKQVELAELSGISKYSISHYLKGDWEGKQDAVYELAKALNVSEAWLMGYDVPRDSVRLVSSGTGNGSFVVRHLPNEEEMKRKAAAEQLPLPAGATRFMPQQVAPLLGTVRAGLPMYADENIEEYIPIRQTDGAAYFWLNIRGDSMNAAGMDEGDQILVREQPEVENGEIAVVLVNGNEATVKTFRQEGDLVILTPRSTNPVHQPQVYDLKKTPISVLGKVVECRKVF